MPNYEYVHYQDKLYYVYRKFKYNQVKEQYIQEIKEMFLCDIVVRQKNQENDLLFFLREVVELEILN
jgi:hypothetical protein